MRISKFIIALIIFLITTLLNIVFSADSFPYVMNNTYRIDISNIESADFCEISQKAKQNNLIYYTLTYKQISLYESECTIFSSEDETDYVWKKHLGLKEGEVRGLNSKIILKSESIQKLIEDSNLKLAAGTGYLIGDTDNCNRFVRELNNSGFSVTGTSNNIKIERIIPYMFIVLSCVILLFYCFLDSSYKKKETAIRSIHGESPVWNYIKHTITDLIFFTIIITFCIAVQFMYTQIPNMFKTVYYIYPLFLSGVIIVNLNLVKINAKEIVYGHQISSMVLKALSFMGMLASAASCGIILFIIGLTPDISKYQKAESFLLENKAKSFFAFNENLAISTQLTSENDNISSEAAEKLLNDYRRFFREQDELLKPICIKDISPLKDDLNSDSKQYNYIYCNHRATNYISEAISELNKYNADNNDAVILFPDNYSSEEIQAAKSYLINEFKSCEGYIPEKLMEITYKPSTEIMCFSSDSESNLIFYGCPAVIIASDTYKRQASAEINQNHLQLLTGTIFDTSEIIDMNEIMKNYCFDISSTNAYEYFKMNFDLQKSVIYVSIALTIAILIYYIFVLYTVLKLDYQVNAVELAVKKTLGYTMFQKNKKHFTGAFAITAINLIISVIIYVESENTSLLQLLSVPLTILLLNILLLSILIHKTENARVIKILKGGAL